MKESRRQFIGYAVLAARPAVFSSLAGCGTGVGGSAVRPLEDRPSENNARAGGVEVLLCDIFGTTVDWTGSLISQFQQFGRQRDIRADWQRLAEQWQATYLPSLMDVRENRRPFVGLETLRRESLDRMLPSFGLGGLAESDRVELVRCWARLDAWPDTVAALTRSRRKYTIAAFSNGGSGLLIEMARHAGLPWDAVLSADLFRHFKPDVEVYRGAADLLARPPASVMVVAAHNIDLAAARAIGMKTAYVQRPTEDAAPTSPWDIVARDFSDLAGLLGA